MDCNACGELFKERKVEMQDTSEETLKFKRNAKRALIIFAIIEFVVTAVGLFFYVRK